MSYSTYTQGPVLAQHNNQIKKEVLHAPITKGVQKHMKKYSQIFLSLFVIVVAIHSRADTNSPNGDNEMKFGMHVAMTAIPGKGEELAAIMLDASKLVSTLKGCQIYVVQLSTSEKDTVLITEVWDSEEDHKASLSVPEIRELIGTARPLIASMAHHTAKPLGGVGI